MERNMRKFRDARRVRLAKYSGIERSEAGREVHNIRYINLFYIPALNCVRILFLAFAKYQAYIYLILSFKSVY